MLPRKERHRDHKNSHLAHEQWGFSLNPAGLKKCFVARDAPSTSLHCYQQKNHPVHVALLHVRSAKQRSTACDNTWAKHVNLISRNWFSITLESLCWNRKRGEDWPRLHWPAGGSAPSGSASSSRLWSRRGRFPSTPSAAARSWEQSSWFSAENMQDERYWNNTLPPEMWWS